MTQQQRELAKYRESTEERNKIFTSLAMMGVTQEQLLKASKAFDVMAQGSAEVMMGLWRELHQRMSN